MGLFTAIWMKEKLSVQQQEKAKRKVMKLKDKKLIQAATEAPVGAIRAAAVQRLTDREALWEIALKDGDGYVRYAALRQLAMKGDQGALEKLCGLLIDPFTAEAAVTILREVYAETRAEIIRRHCGDYMIPHNDYAYDCSQHYDEDGTIHLDVE